MAAPAGLLPGLMTAKRQTGLGSAARRRRELPQRAESEAAAGEAETPRAQRRTKAHRAVPCGTARRSPAGSAGSRLRPCVGCRRAPCPGAACSDPPGVSPQGELSPQAPLCPSAALCKSCAPRRHVRTRCTMGGVGQPIRTPKALATTPGLCHNLPARAGLPPWELGCHPVGRCPALHWSPGGGGQRTAGLALSQTTFLPG